MVRQISESIQKGKLSVRLLKYDFLLWTMRSPLDLAQINPKRFKCNCNVQWSYELLFEVEFIPCESHVSNGKI